MFRQFITPVTTKLSFTNASDPQRLTSPISTISFYSNTNTPTIENVPCSAQGALPTSDSCRDNILKSSIYFDYPTPPNPSVERTSLMTFNHTQDEFRLDDTSVSIYPSSTYNCSQISPVSCPKTPIYATKACDISQKVPIESPKFYPSSSTSPTNTTDFSKVHNVSINSPQYCSHQVPNDSLEFHTLSPISSSSVNELKRSTLSEKKGNSIEQSTSIGKIKFSKVHDVHDEPEDKENNLGETYKIDNESIDAVDIDESVSESILSDDSDSDVTSDVNQTLVKASNESSVRWKKGIVRRSTRLAVKPALNYRV